MNIMRILCVLLYFASSWNTVESTEWVDNMIKYIVDESKFKLVKLMTRLDDNEILEDGLIEEIFVKVMDNLPTMRIDIGKDFELPENSVPDETSKTRTPIDTSETLFLLVIDHRNSLSISIGKNFIDAVAKMTVFHYSPKYLILSSGREPSEHFEELLNYAWTKYKMLDLTILELTTVARHLNATASSLTYPTIHQFNPFKKNYTNEKWTGKLNNLFPNKVTDMSGYPLRIYEFLWSGSLSILFWIIYGRKFNCSIDSINSNVPRNAWDNWRAVYLDAESENVDVIPYEHPFYSASWNDSLRSAPIMIDQFCIIVPILPTKKAALPTNVFMATFLSIGLILIFWVFMRLLRFRTYPWRMFNIGRVLFGVSISTQPRGNVERVIFMCLLAIFAGFSSTIYEGLTDITWQIDAEIEFQSFEELDNSGLTLQFEHAESERISELLKGPLKFMKNKTVEVDSAMWCGLRLAVEKNYTCLMKKLPAEITMAMSLKEIDDVAIKFAKPCLWSEAYSYPLGKRSPYRASIDKLILRMHSAGLFEKQITDDIASSSIKKYLNRSVQRKRNIPSTHQQLIVIAIVGYSLSIFVFICEIIYHRVSLYIKSRRRPFTPRFPFVL